MNPSGGRHRHPLIGASALAEDALPETKRKILHTMSLLNRNDDKASSLSSGKIIGGVKKGKISKPILIAVGIAAVLLFVFLLTFLGQQNQTEPYYVVAQDIPAHSKITEDDIQKVEARKGTAPKSIPLSQIQQGSVYAQYDLLAGDVLSPSNTGGRSNLYDGVSDSWAVTSFTINSSDAVDGNIQRGDYFDILALGSKTVNGEAATEQSNAAITSNQGGSYLYYNVLCLYTTAHKTSKTAKDGTTTTTGESTEYFVAMPPKDIAMLQSAMTGLTVKLVMSPRENTYKEPNADAYGFATFNYNGQDLKPRNASACNDETSKSEDCTDNTFHDVRRNKFGVPFNATSKELDDNGNLKHPKKLTKAETEWCTTIFKDPYYLGSRWDYDKDYCLDQGFSKKQAKSLSTEAKKSKGEARQDGASKQNKDQNTPDAGNDKSGTSATPSPDSSEAGSPSSDTSEE